MINMTKEYFKKIYASDTNNKYIMNHVYLARAFDPICRLPELKICKGFG